MGKNINRVFLAGVIDGLPEISNIEDNIVAKFDLLTVDGKETLKHHIKAFGKRAEQLRGVGAGPGVPIAIEGKLDYAPSNRYTSQVEIVASRVSL